MIESIIAGLELSPGILGYCLVCVFLGAYLKGFTGFGASMFWVVSLSIVLPPLQVVPMVLMFEVATSIYLLPAIWKEIQWSSISLLLVGTWIATPVGIYLLASLPAKPIRLALALVVLYAAVMILRGFSLQRVPGKTATIGTGMAAGVLNGSMGIVGPPVILFYFSSPIGVTVGRASIITYFIGTDTVGTMMFHSQGIIEPAVFWRTLAFLPLLFLGSAIGNRGYIRTAPETFKKIALYVLIALACLLFARALLI